MINASILSALSSLDLSRIALAAVFDRSLSDEEQALIAQEIERRENLSQDELEESYWN